MQSSLPDAAGKLSMPNQDVAWEEKSDEVFTFRIVKLILGFGDRVRFFSP